MARRACRSDDERRLVAGMQRNDDPVGNGLAATKPAPRSPVSSRSREVLGANSRRRRRGSNATTTKERITMSSHTSKLSSSVHHRSAPARPARAFSPRRLIPATGVALAASLAGDLAIRGLAVSGATDTSRFSPLRPVSVISLTVIGVLMATATCLWLNRTSGQPLATFRRVALVALPLSFVPDAAIWLTSAYPHTGSATVLPLMAMHVLVAIVCLVALPSLGQAHAGA
jgi:hypothetical protein